MIQTRFIPTWIYGLTSSWSIGARVPVTRSQAASEEEKTQEVNNQNDTQLGNVEIMSKEQIFNDNKSSFALAQRMRFPSAEPVPENIMINTFPEPSGYGLGFGVLYGYKINRYWSVGLNFFQDINFKDNIKGYNSFGEKIETARNPGDKTTVAVQIEATPGDDFLVSMGLTQKFKSEDNYKKEIMFSNDETAVQQNIAEIGVGYQQKVFGDGISQTIDSFSARFKYYATLDGKNIEDTEIMSLQLQITY